MNIINIYDNFNSYFNAELKAIFERCSKIALENGFKIYLIGGLVRDMLLNQQSLDIDITVEGNAIEFAQIIEKEGGKILSIHQSFGTAKVEFYGQKIDLASTRSEIYPKKGHLPKVEEIGCSLKKDVLRRDFTINSIAMSLNQDNFANLIDYTGGFTDLKAKKIRILHDLSFIDDPTRIIRGLKYASRLNFELDKHTLKLQEEYLNNINYDMGIKRIKQEFKKTFDNCNNWTFNKFLEQNIYKLITTKSISQPNIEPLMEKLKPKHQWLVYFGICVINEDINKFELTKSEKEVIDGAKCLLNSTFNTNFELYKAFCAQKLETLLILAALGKEKEVLHYFDNLSKIKVTINGKDLIKLGKTPSKKFTEVFDYILKEKLKNPTLSQAEELQLAKIYLD